MREVNCYDGPVAFGEIDGILAGAAGEVEGARGGMGAREERKTFDEKGGGIGGRLAGGFAVAEVPTVE